MSGTVAEIFLGRYIPAPLFTNTALPLLLASKVLAAYLHKATFMKTHALVLL